MISQPNILKGIIHGKTIELDREPGIPDGQEVTVSVQPAGGTRRLPPGEGLRRSAGAWAEDAEELGKFLDWNRRQRKLGRPETES